MLVLQEEKEETVVEDKLRAENPQEMKEITDTKAFESIISNSGTKPVFVFFMTEQCGDCKDILPQLKDISNRIDQDEADLLTVNIDQQSEIPAKFEVSTVPHLITIRSGQKQEQVGGTDISKYYEMLERQLGKKVSEIEYNPFCDYNTSSSLFKQSVGIISLKCIKMDLISRDTYMIELEFPNKEWTSGIWPGGHMKLILEKDGKWL